MSYPVYNVTCDACGKESKAFYKGSNYAGVRYAGKCKVCGKTIAVANEATWLEEQIPPDGIELKAE